jgi:hypothetical protein
MDRSIPCAGGKELSFFIVVVNILFSVADTPAISRRVDFLNNATSSGVDIPQQCSDLHHQGRHSSTV